MATLNSSNVSNGNIIEPNDILQLYDALTAGGGTTGAYDISISGSLTGSATSASAAISASFAVSSSRAVSASFAVSSSHAVSASFSTSASFAVSSSRAVSASFSTTASYALNGGATQVDGQRYISSAVPGTISSGNFKFIAGGGSLNAGAFTSSIYNDLVGKTMGQNAWINASYTGDTGTIGATEPTLLVNLSSSGQITIDQVSGADDAQIVWTGIFI